MTHVRTRPRTLRGLLATACIAMLLSTTGVAAAQTVPPVDGVVVDAFRPPAHIGAPGNRGWEYATVPGTPVRAVLAGTVVFAGPVAGRWYVSIDHPGGLRTTYGGVDAVSVSVGDAVLGGDVIAATGARFHFGVRRDGDYIDPALLFGSGVAGPIRLVPRPGRVPDRGSAQRSDSVQAPLHSTAGPNQDQLRRGQPGTDQSPPRTTHGRRLRGVGPRLR